MRNIPFGWEFLIFSFFIEKHFFTFHFSFFTENVVPLQLIDRQNEISILNIHQFLWKKLH